MEINKIHSPYLLINSLIFSDCNNGIIFIISFSSKSHHFILSNFSIVSSLKRYFIILAGFPAVMEYGGIFFVTTELAPIMEPSLIVTPESIFASLPIHTSFPIFISHFVCGCHSICSKFFNNALNGYVVIKSLICSPPNKKITPFAIEQNFPMFNFVLSSHSLISKLP